MTDDDETITVETRKDIHKGAALVSEALTLLERAGEDGANELGDIVGDLLRAELALWKRRTVWGL